MIVEGKNPVREALKSGVTVEKLMVLKGSFDREISQIIALAKKADVKVIYVDKPVLDKASQTKRHQGVLMSVTDFKYSSVKDIVQSARDAGEDLFVIILDGVTDPHNLGSVIRVAECVGAHGVIIPERRSATVNDTVVKVSAGAIAHVKVARVTNVNDVIRDLRDDFVKVYAAEAGGELIYNADLKGDIALVIGGEDTGVHALTKKLCDGVVSLPVCGKVNSLNASVACGAVCYEALRQRRK